MSDTTFRAITTRYQGYNFRSRLEARWAVFFDHLGIRWDYEPEGFELGNGLRYLPDFWLPDWNMWVEIKPGPPDHMAAEKAWRLVRATGAPLFAAHGMPDAPGTLFVSRLQVGGEVALWDMPAAVAWADCVVFSFHGGIDASELSEIEQNTAACFMAVSDTRREPEIRQRLSTKVEGALLAARGARFEFGAKGAL